MPNDSYTFSLPCALLDEAKEVSEVTGIPVACLVKFGLVEVIAEHQKRITKEVIDADTMTLLIEHEIETGMCIKEQIKEAMKRTQQYRKTP